MEYGRAIEYPKKPMCLWPKNQKQSMTLKNECFSAVPPLCKEDMIENPQGTMEGRERTKI